MKLSDDIRDVADEEHYSVTAKLYNGWADEVAQLEAELAECRETLGEWLEKHDVRIDELETENETLRDNYEKVKAALAAMLMRHGEHGNLTREQLEDYVGDALPTGGVMNLSEELKLWGYHSDISGKGMECHLEMAERATHLEAALSQREQDCIDRTVESLALEAGNEALRLENGKLERMIQAKIVQFTEENE